MNRLASLGLLAPVFVLACSTMYEAQLESGSTSHRALDVASGCLREIGLQPAAERPNEALGRSSGLTAMDGVPADWYGERLYVGISRNDKGLAFRMLANATFDRLATAAADDLKACLSQRAPELPFSIQPRRFFDIR